MTTSKHKLPQATRPISTISATEQAGGLLLLLGLVSLLGIWRWWRSQRRPWLVLPVLSQLATILLAWMYRNPERQATSGERAVLAPADGLVTRVDQARESRFGAGPCWRITTRSAWHDVQVHRAPVEGTVSLRQYEIVPSKPGNQHACWIRFDMPEDTDGPRALPGRGEAILVHSVTRAAWRLIPVYAAKRLHVWADLGDRVQTGDETGLMPLGGLVETYVPVGASIRVRAGQAVRAGETVLAILPAPATP